MLKSILNRRSIRQYTGQKVADDAVRALLDAAMSAPSAGNERPWHFVVVHEGAMLEKLSRTHRNAGMIKNASVAIAVCGDLRLEIKKGMWVQDCAAATENILIEAEENNLGAVWVGVYPREDRVEYVKNLFDLPDHIVPLSIVSVGYPAERFEPVSRFDPSRIHYERW